MIRPILFAIGILLLGGGLVGCDDDTQPPGGRPPARGGAIQVSAEPAEAVAELHPLGGSNIRGTVRFIELEDRIKIIAAVEGLNPNQRHGIHIHEGRACGPTGQQAGEHYNPENHPHGGPNQPTRHAGDLGNLQADADGKAYDEIIVDNITIHGEENPVVGRTVIVHAQPDDLVTQPAGGAGDRLACGVIQLTE